MQEFIQNFNKKLDDKIKQLGIEIHQRINYGIMVENNDIDLKLMVKSLLTQQDQTYPYTHIEIAIKDYDFILKATNSNIFIYGEYQKLCRNMSQTKFFKKDIPSVEDFSDQLIQFFQCKKINFIGFGREDIDVQMIGYRPFILEIIAPTRNLNFKSLDLNLNTSVSLKNFKIVDPKIKYLFHEKMESKHKTYRTLIFCKNMRKLSLGRINIQQKTPLRVLHRRGNLMREKELEILELRQDGNFCECIIKAEAGTYIKEFINGDFGRTKPSISDVMNEYADCLELDVLEIEQLEIPKEFVIDECNLNIIK